MALRAAVPLFLIALLFISKSQGGDVGDWSVARLASGDGGLDGHDSAVLTCDGLVGECMGEEDEMEMESEITRRVLRAVSRRYISYGALSRNRVPCNRRGQSYYNCRPRGRANPYRRGCSVITRCARIVH